MTLYILKYNNYYNRLVKLEETVSDYQDYVVYTLQDTNFNPNDHVNTQHVVGAGDYDGSGDYVIITETRRKPIGAPVGWEEYVVSRWFIIESQRTRAGQWQLTLRRDLVVDHYDELLDAPMFIEKATLGDGDPLIYNSENMTFNQIKQSETLLKDETNSAWIVGYMSSKPNVDG